MEGAIATWQDSWIGVGVTSGDGMSSRVVVVGSLRKGVMEASDQVQESWFMILLQDTCRDHGMGQILITTDAPIHFRACQSP